MKSTDTHVTAVLWSLHKEGRDRVELVCRGLRASEKPDLLLHAHLLPDAQPIELGATHAERLPERKGRVWKGCMAMRNSA